MNDRNSEDFDASAPDTTNDTQVDAKSSPHYTAQEFIQRLVELSIIDAKVGAQVSAGLESAASIASIVDVFEKRGLLTAYQAQKIVAGHADHLRFGHYLVVDRLGVGGMGEVLKARHLTLGRFEAIKTILDPEDNQGLSERFEREARVLALLQHPGIVPIWGFGDYRSGKYIAMKFVEGEDLSAAIENAEEADKKLPLEDCCRWASEAASALHAAHVRNIVHRDMKPGNLMLSRGGQIYVLDVGIARIADPNKGQEAQGGLTVPRRGLGTPQYMPPE
ncbi:MAG: serine/threonine-protein kinase, partial [Planctomycetia bacterium]